MSQMDSKMATLDHDSFCSAPPLILLPRPSRAQEARRPRAPIWTGKREATELEYAINDADAIDVKPEVGPRMAPDEHRMSVRVAACTIRPVSASAASSPEAQRHPLPSFRARMATVAIRPATPSQDPCHAPAARLGPADPPRKPGRPVGSKSRPRVAALATSSSPPPVRAAAKASAAKTRRSLTPASRR